MSRTWADCRDLIQSRVIISDLGCWNWTGACDPDGYARMSFRGANRRVSRVTWSAHNEQEWPQGLWALHSCDNRRCVNPGHIRPGTSSENVREAWERGGLRKLRHKTHCPKGHEWTPETTAYFPSTGTLRRCKICDRQNATIQNAKRKAREQAAKEIVA